MQHKKTIGDGIRIVKKGNKITKKVKGDIIRTRHEVVRAVTNYTQFVLRFLAYISEKIVEIFAPAIAAEDVEYEHDDV